MAAAWLSSDFQELHEGLLAVAELRPISVAGLQDLLQVYQDDLKKLLDQSPKSDASRQKVTSGNININDEEYQVNQEFIQATIQIADDLDLDELAAAELLLLGQQEADRIDRTPSQAAAFIFHSRRQFLLESHRLLYALAWDDRLEREIRDVLFNTVNYVVGPVSLKGKGDFAQKCISSMASIRSWLKGLAEKGKTALFLQMSMTSDYMDDIKLQATFLTNQHQSLGAIIYHLVMHGFCGIQDLEPLKSNLRVHREYDVLLMHQLLGFITIINQVGIIATKLTTAEVMKLHEDFIKSGNDEIWELQFVHAACHLWWYTEFNGLVRDTPSNLSLDVEYMKQIHVPSKLTLNNGAFDFLMAAVANVNKTDDFDAAQEDFRRFLQTKTPFEPQSAMTTDDDFKRLFLLQVELFVDSFISNMADLLKEVKNTEEEDHLLQRETTYNLERFFIVISLLYQNRLEAGITFWRDKDSNLYGFLTWASERQTPLMAAAYCDVLASLAYGNKSADATDQFLRDAGSISGISKARPTHQISWDYIFQSIQYYADQLRPRQEQNPQQPIRGLPPLVEPVELGAESTRVLDGYLRLITVIVEWSESARIRFYENPKHRAIPTLFDLLGGPLPGILLGAVFKTLKSFCKGKSSSDGDRMWIKLDKWLLGSSSAAPQQNTGALTITTSPKQPTDKFEVIGDSYSATEAFINLLIILLRPADDTVDDGLPFPENLGTSTRLAGIDPYVDFVMTLFGQSNRIDPVHGFARWTEAELPLIQLGCLKFMLSCLSSFNEQLIIVANTSSVSVDTAIETSNLAAYVKLHPFARVMDYLFSEAVLSVLFKIVAQGVEQTSELLKTSPKVEIVYTSIKIMDAVMELQHTYLEVVRPLVWRDEGSIKKGISTVGLSSFEDAVLYHLDVIVHLGIYAGAQHAKLAISALSLLTKLSVSPKLLSSPSAVYDRQLRQNRLLSITNMEGESRRIAFGFISQLETTIDTVDTEESPEDQRDIKLGILKFIESTLSKFPNEPSLAHLILGFSTSNSEVNISEEGSGIGSGISVFHSILNIISIWDERDETGLQFDTRQLEIKSLCFRILRTLWQSPLTSSDTMYVLRENKFLFAQFSQEVTISTSTIWDDGVAAPEPWESSAVSGCTIYMSKRTIIFDYISNELRQMSLLGAVGTIRQYISSLAGVTEVFGTTITHASIFDLLDFLELEPQDAAQNPQLQFFADLDFSTYQTESDGVKRYDLEGVKALVLLRKTELFKQNRIQPQDEDAATSETDDIVEFCYRDNHMRLYRAARVECLRYWCRLIIVILETAQFDMTEKANFLLQALQTILPKFELYSGTNISCALELSSLAQSLVTDFDFAPETLGSGRASDVANERLYQLFKVSLRALQSPIATGRLREDCYSIICTYLVGMNDLATKGSTLNRHNMQTIRASGERLLDIICNDAYVGAGSCKLLALLAMDALILLGQQENSTYVLEGLLRQNFIVVLVQSLKRIDQEAAQVIDGGVALTAMIKASTGVLLRLSRTKAGASMVINAGYFHILRECGLFDVDPDVGVSFKGETDLARYYDLVLAFVRVLVSCLLSKGTHSKSEVLQTKKFLSEIRGIVVSIMKKHANIGSVAQDTQNMGILVDMFVLLFCIAENGDVDLA